MIDGQDLLGEAPGMVGACAACAGVPGSIHVCEGSGTAVAEAAHQAGAVTERPQQERHFLHIQMQVQGTTAQATELGQALVTRLLEHPAVDQAVVSVQ